MPKKLPQNFYQSDTLKVARELLGKYLIRKIGSKKIIGQIIETEAYCGPNDLASHASCGRTARTEIMFGPAGYLYVYMIYGMYYCLNIVTEEKDNPSAVLIRAVKPVAGLDSKIKTDGPGKLCRAFKIDKKQNNTKVFGKEAEIWIEDWQEKTNKIKSSPRIGVDYAQEYRDKPWRFYIED
ncbi:MAG: DNA-3-methyladenine glycosylase [Candidatus Buchananbacteria bacterium]|nr:DNA-3-methyladenine glycosylase [Candidatus Buchananbacteria bacterium]